MNKKELEEFKMKLMKQKQQVMNKNWQQSKEELHVSSDDLSDEADYANNMVSQQMSFSLQERDLIKLRKIDKALMKIEKGDYGHCEDCGEEINHKRLEKQPWAELCLEHAEEQEKHAHLHLKRA
jgi:DnaK suppressor protein